MASFTEPELWAKAAERVRRHGPDALIFAALKVDRFLEQGDLDGLHHWCVILRRTNLLLEQNET